MKTNILLLLFIISFLNIGNQLYAQSYPPKGWHLQGYEKDGVYGVDVYRALEYLQKNGLKGRKVRVAVIDSGIATNHQNLAPIMWVNKNEIPGDGIDNDNNGYVDDINGWNFLCKENNGVLNIAPEEFDKIFVRDMDKYLNAKREDFRGKERKNYDYFWNVIYKKSKIGKVHSQIKLDNSYANVFEKNVAMTRKNIAVRYNKKTSDDKMYGVPNINSRNLSHGSHVAGIIGGVKAEDFMGVCPSENVEIIGIRVIPDGDEYDEDVANAIRYAVDNGAEIINMSFGRYASENKKLVNDAFDYGIKKGVLFIKASGNDGINTDVEAMYPYPDFFYNLKRRAKNFIVVGSSDIYGEPAYSSNWGKKGIDLFAPGVGIYSTERAGHFMYMNGTSMAAPVVTGIAALLKSYFPSLKTSQISDIIMTTVTKRPNAEAKYPSKTKNLLFPATGPFEELSKTGGIANAYRAVVKAHSISKSK